MDPANTSGSTHNNSHQKLVKFSDCLQCCICQRILRNTHICRRCSQPFCRECIGNWLAQEGKCPCCRNDLAEPTLIKVRAFDQLAEIMHEEEQNQCPLHIRELLFFCLRCKESICERCMFAESHQGHMDKLVLLEVAFEHYNKRVNREFLWIKNRAHALKVNQERIKKNKDLLNAENDRQNDIVLRALATITSSFQQEMNKQDQMQETIEKHDAAISALQATSRDLEIKEKNAATLRDLINHLDVIRKFRSDPPPTVVDISVNFENDFTPKPITVQFLIGKFMQNINQTEYCESPEHQSDGFVWRMRVTRVSQKYDVSLIMEEGLRGTYWVAYRDGPMMPYEFEPHKNVLISVANTRDDLGYDARYDWLGVMFIRMHLAKTYPERCKQLEEHIRLLEMRIKELERKTSRKRPVATPVVCTKQAKV